MVSIEFSPWYNGCTYTCPCWYRSHHFMVHCTGCGEKNTNQAK